MIPSLDYTSKNLYIYNQVRFRLTYLLLDLGLISLYIKTFII